MKHKNKDRLVYKIYRERRAEYIKDKMRDKKNWCYWTWRYLKDHLEHVWESEQVPKASEFNKLVSNLIARKSESEWREEMQKKKKLRNYRR